MDEKKFLEECENIKVAETVEDFYLFQISTSNYFSSKGVKYQSVANTASVTRNILLSDNFTNTLKKVLEQYVAFKKNFDSSAGLSFFEEFDKIEVKNKKVMFSAMISSLLPFVMSIEKMTENEIVAYSDSFIVTMVDLKTKLANKYSLGDIHLVLTSVFSKEFYPKITVPSDYIFNDRQHLYKYQKASSFLMSLSLKLYFKHATLNNLFKSLEKSRRNDDIHAYDVCRINSIIKSNVKSEESSLKVLSDIYGSQEKIDIFCKVFRKNKNEENVYDLISIIFRDFKLGERFDLGIITTIKNNEAISRELIEYGKANFMAFSNVIDERNSEWSNKVYINCRKLLGALGGLDGAVDIGWQRNAAVKEFYNWISDVHKILNKYDIEDDWDKVSKYLEQETNTVEWKSNFFTPTQMLATDPGYNEIKNKIFKGIIKTIIGMMNTDGGVLIVGLVENPEEIVNLNQREALVHRNKQFFYDVSSELMANKFDLDGLKRKIQQEIKRETLKTEDNFNNLWTIEPISLKSQDGLSEIFIYKITVKKSPSKIFSVLLQPAEADSKKVPMAKTDNFWISLLRRADASTIYTDARKYLGALDI